MTSAPPRSFGVAPVDKSDLRAAALARRGALEAPARARFALAMADLAETLPLPDGPVSGYWPIRGEIDPRPLMHRLAARGATLALPRVRLDGLGFHVWHPGDPLEKAGFGLSEPLAGAPAVRPATMLVPLVAFDRRGHRIGYGIGHYDRAIAQAGADGHPLVTVGVAFAVQEIPRVPDEPHDRTLDWIVTECEIVAPIRP